jgi:hypothetical protein
MSKAISKLVIVLIVIFMILVSFLVVYVSGLLPFGNRGSVELIGSCNDTTYYLPDTVGLVVTDVTTTSNSTISYYLSTVTTVPASTQTLGSSTFTTTTYAHDSSVRSYTLVATTNLDNYTPSAAWIVSICTYIPK